MTDAQAALAQVREALAVGPTPGPWHHCQPFQSVRAERTIHGPVPAQRVDFVSTKTQPVHERIIIPMAGREAHVRSEDMAFIAACNPENIAALLAHVEAQEAEIKRLRAGRDNARARFELAAKLLTDIHALLYLPPTTLPDGRTFVFRPENPDSHTVLQTLSDRIRALPDEIAAINEAKEQR